MDSGTILKIVEDFSRALQRHGVKDPAVFLYGSCATGKDTEFSDIDLAVVSMSFRDMALLDRIDLLSDAIYDVWQPIEAIGFTPEEWERGDSAMAQIAREGTAVYRSGNSASAIE